MSYYTKDNAYIEYCRTILFKIVQTIKGDDIHEKVLTNALGWIRNGRKTTLHDWKTIRIVFFNIYEAQTKNNDKGDTMILSEKYHHDSQTNSQN